MNKTRVKWLITSFQVSFQREQPSGERERQPVGGVNCIGGERSMNLKKKKGNRGGVSGFFPPMGSLDVGFEFHDFLLPPFLIHPNFRFGCWREREREAVVGNLKIWEYWRSKFFGVNLNGEWSKVGQTFYPATQLLYIFRYISVVPIAKLVLKLCKSLMYLFVE